VAEHELQPLSARRHATVLALESRALGVEKRFVEIEETIADLAKTKRRDGHETSRDPRSSLRHAQGVARLDESRTVEPAVRIGVDDEIDGAVLALQRHTRGGLAIAAQCASGWRTLIAGASLVGSGIRASSGTYLPAASSRLSRPASRSFSMRAGGFACAFARTAARFGSAKCGSA
jgi:hypothetical protein